MDETTSAPPGAQEKPEIGTRVGLRGGLIGFGTTEYRGEDEILCKPKRCATGEVYRLEYIEGWVFVGTGLMMTPEAYQAGQRESGFVIAAEGAPPAQEREREVVTIRGRAVELDSREYTAATMAAECAFDQAVRQALGLGGGTPLPAGEWRLDLENIVRLLLEPLDGGRSDPVASRRARERSRLEALAEFGDATLHEEETRRAFEVAQRSWRSWDDMREAPEGEALLAAMRRLDAARADVLAVQGRPMPAPAGDTVPRAAFDAVVTEYEAVRANLLVLMHELRIYRSPWDRIPLRARDRLRDAVELLRVAEASLDLAAISESAVEGYGKVAERIRRFRRDGRDASVEAPTWMMAIGVEGDRYNPHFLNDQCEGAGCVRAHPHEIPGRETAEARCRGEAPDPPHPAEAQWYERHGSLEGYPFPAERWNVVAYTSDVPPTTPSSRGHPRRGDVWRDSEGVYAVFEEGRGWIFGPPKAITHAEAVPL